MVMRTVRVGSLPGFQYDDADFTGAIETDQPVKAGTPVDPEDVIRLSDITGLPGDLVSTAGAATVDNIAEFDNISGKVIKDGGLTHLSVADAVSKKHTQDSDQYLDEGGANEVTAANAADAVSKKHTHADVTQDITVVTDVVGPTTAVLHFTNGLLTSVT